MDLFCSLQSICKLNSRLVKKFQGAKPGELVYEILPILSRLCIQTISVRTKSSNASKPQRNLFITDIIIRFTN